MIWIGMILAVIWAQSLQGWSEWGFRITVLSSLGANLVVAILSGTRRRLASGRWRRWLGQLAKLCLWLACQVADLATTSAIGNLSLSSSEASEEEMQVVAFWATFLLLHLGGPDNLSAYALEDNKISSRNWIEMIYRILGVIYAIYKNTHRGGRNWAMLPAASVIMLFAGAVRYCERVTAQGEANLDSMQEDASSRSSEDDIHKKKMKSLKCRIKSTKRRWRSLCDGEALLLAQDLFPIWRHALVDSSVNPKSERQKASEKILSASESDERDWDWDSMCKVAEMELSLIYEFLYTKAIRAQTSYYYLIRLLSPLFTAAAAFLFCYWQQQQQQQGVGGSYVRITYALLAITFLMDVAWLLRALGSTWAYAYLQEQAPAWLRHQALHTCERWWHSLHRIVVGLDPLRLLFCRDPVCHRRWSGTIGRYNLLHECTATTRICWSQCPEWWPWSGAGDDTPKEMRYLSKVPPCVKELVFKRVTKLLQQSINTKENKNNEKMYNRQDIRTKWGHKAFCTSGECICRPVDGDTEEQRKKKEKDKEERIFGQEFEEDVLLWHIATCMILPHIRQKGGKIACAIEVMSEYMMFLVAIRRQMLPGLVLHSQLQVTRDTLVKDMWAGGKGTERLKLDEESKRIMNNKEKLAMILRHVRSEKEVTEQQWTADTIEGDEGTQLLANAVDLYFELSGEKRTALPSRTVQVPDEAERLEFIFNVWVDKLVYAAVRCSREAHAQQLSAGGDLTTVLWMLIQHAGPFCMGEAPNIYIIRPDARPEEKKKYPEPSLPKKEEPAPPPPPPKEKPPPPKPKHPPPKEQPAPPPPPPKPAPPPPKEKPAPPPPPLPAFLPPTTPGLPPYPAFPPPAVAGFPPLPPYCPVCPPCYHPSYPPMWPPCYDPSWRPVCPWCPQCPHQHEKPRDKPEASRGDEGEDSSSDEDSEE